MITHRAALIGLFCAPAIIRPGVLMPIKPVALAPDPRVMQLVSEWRWAHPDIVEAWRNLQGLKFYGGLELST